LFSDSLMVVFISGDCIEIGLLFGPNADVELECVRNTSDPKKIIEMCLPIEALINDALQVSGMKFVQLSAGLDVPIHVEKTLLVRDNRNNIVGYFDSEDIESSDA